MEMSSKSEWKKPELGKLDYLLYIFYIVLCSGGQWRPPAHQSETAWRSTSNRNIWSYFTKLTNPLFQISIFFSGGSSSTHVHQIHPYVFPWKFPKFSKFLHPKMLLFETKVQEALIEAGSVMRPAVDVSFLGIHGPRVLLGAFCWGFFGKTSAKITLPEN